MKKIMLALFAAAMMIGVVGCNSEDDSKTYQPQCDAGDKDCIELYNDGMGRGAE